ncbi:hypothetical protein ANN_02263 [Periplaneta americana]|uniref:Uncharacterized protein n=1 Tax=Periplaneta americana TaxID=6978 RepID=A0ABQ8TXJ8_PERAM|nr:hypothetical protein ANN_02263 [Periplaneta americana]
MSPGSSTESYPAFARIGLRENPGKNLNQVTCPGQESNPGHLVSRPDALTVTPQVWTPTIDVLPYLPPCILEARLYKRREYMRPCMTELPSVAMIMAASPTDPGLMFGRELKIHPTQEMCSTLKKKSPGRNSIALRLSEATVRSRALRLLSLGPFEGCVKRGRQRNSSSSGAKQRRSVLKEKQNDKPNDFCADLAQEISRTTSIVKDGFSVSVVIKGFMIHINNHHPRHDRPAGCWPHVHMPKQR